MALKYRYCYRYVFAPNAPKVAMFWKGIPRGRYNAVEVQILILIKKEDAAKIQVLVTKGAMCSERILRKKDEAPRLSIRF